MTTIDLQDGTKLSVFDSIFELMTNEYTELRANELLAIGIGDIYATLERAMIAAGDGDSDRALIETQNAYIAIKHIEARHEVSQVQFGWLLDQINGEKVIANTGEDRQKIVVDLGRNGLSQQMVLEYLETVKKNWILN